jgi:hypothetical protein
MLDGCIITLYNVAILTTIQHTAPNLITIKFERDYHETSSYLYARKYAEPRRRTNYR